MWIVEKAVFGGLGFKQISFYTVSGGFRSEKLSFYMVLAQLSKKGTEEGKEAPREATVKNKLLKQFMIKFRDWG